MGYSGAVPGEDSSGERVRRGAITKTGNAHLRRVVIEAAWSYRLRPRIGPVLQQRQKGVSEEVKEIAWKAQLRLHKRYQRLMTAGKDQRKIITAVGRELLGLSGRSVPGRGAFWSAPGDDGVSPRTKSKTKTFR